MVHQNLGKLDRIFRFLLAFWWLGPWAPVYVADWANLTIAVVGWIALAEAFAGWCFLQKLLGINNTNQ